MTAQPLPPALTAVVAWALTNIRAIGLDTMRTMLDRDPSSLRAFAYRDRATLRAALDEFEALPPDTPNRTKLAALLAHVLAQSTLGTLDIAIFEQAAALAEIANRDPDAPDDWRLYFAMLRAQALTAQARRGTAFHRPRAIVVEFEGYRRLLGSLPAAVRVGVGTAIEGVISMYTALAATMENDPAPGFARDGRSAEPRERTSPPHCSPDAPAR